MRRSLLVVATWLTGTALAVTLAWWAVSRVSSEVTDRPVVPISDDDVAAALGAGPAAGLTTTVPAAGAPATTAPSRTAPAPGPAATSTTRPGATRTTAPPPTVSHAGTTTPPASAPPTTAAPVATTSTIDSVGGQVAVRYSEYGVELLWARAKPGFTAEVGTGGPEQVDVRFVSGDHESRVRAFLENGEPQREVREEEDD